MVYVIAGNHREYMEYLYAHNLRPLGQVAFVREPRAMRCVRVRGGDKVVMVGTWASRRDAEELRWWVLMMTGFTLPTLPQPPCSQVPYCLMRSFEEAP